ncbi:pirin family protein [Marinobacter sp. X15-166B]|uniref:pirin family protein n=1 Tax=Marinobacter sp. X15-166B TaxID=1897620 RepID=UPI00085BCE93|nr:pirin family protein [Marinobacter sp. X15-166B]OEY67583.1 hypothetical protein BG841_14840 [Marinobacter sp. X15-166B]
MSNVLTHVKQKCEVRFSRCTAIELILHPKEADLGGFTVRRLLPTTRLRKVGPWVFFDHMGPANFPAGQGINVRPHPHIGIATVTYLFEGEILHRDSLGSLQSIRPGDINLMVAGRGIVHSERERPETTQADHTLHGLQLWLALPEDQEETAPAFLHYPGSEIPAVEVNGVPVRVMMGSAYGATSPVRVFSDTLYVEALLQPGQSLQLPDAEERALYLADGALKAQDTELTAHSMAVLSDMPGVTVTATQESRLAIIGGGHLQKRFIEWNFVSSRKERIEQAKKDWVAGKFPTVPGDEHEYIPLPDK